MNDGNQWVNILLPTASNIPVEYFLEPKISVTENSDLLENVARISRRVYSITAENETDVIKLKDAKKHSTRSYVVYIWRMKFVCN